MGHKRFARLELKHCPACDMRISVLVLVTLRSEQSLSRMVPNPHNYMQNNNVRPHRPFTENKHMVRTTILKATAHALWITKGRY
jgi:hypothetical protein